MKRCILYIVILLAMLMIPAEGSDVGRLLPVEVFAVDQRAGTVRIETDTGNVGTGSDLEAAYQDLCQSASAEIFLNTADNLILSGDAAQLVGQLRQYLKPNIRVCRSEGGIDLAEVGEYLSIHVPDYCLKDIDKVTEMVILTQTEKGFCLK